MGLGSIWHWLILGAVVLLLFGKGRISDVMGDFGKGLRSFKKGLTEEPETPQKTLTQTTTVDAKAEVREDAKS